MWRQAANYAVAHMGTQRLWSNPGRLAKVMAVARDGSGVEAPHTINLLDSGVVSENRISEARLTTVECEAGAWCRHINATSKSVKKVIDTLL